MKELALNHLPELAPRTVESLNLLRLRLEQTAPDAKIILLTSTTPQEGKTTLALQFWQLLAGLGQRCLLVAPAWFRPPAPPAARPCCWNTPVLPAWWKAVHQSLLIFW